MFVQNPLPVGCDLCEPLASAAVGDKTTAIRT